MQAGLRSRVHWEDYNCSSLTTSGSLQREHLLQTEREGGREGEIKRESSSYTVLHKHRHTNITLVSCLHAYCLLSQHPFLSWKLVTWFDLEWSTKASTQKKKKKTNGRLNRVSISIGFGELLLMFWVMFGLVLSLTKTIKISFILINKNKY